MIVTPCDGCKRLDRCKEEHAVYSYFVSGDIAEHFMPSVDKKCAEYGAIWDEYLRLKTKLGEA